MNYSWRSVLILVTLVFGATASARNFVDRDAVTKDPIRKEIIKSQGRDRPYFLYVPDGLQSSGPSPLIVLLHGSGQNGRPLVQKWQELARNEGVILVGPDTVDLEEWTVPIDAPDPIYDLIESLKAKYSIDARRVYLFGHSAGGVVGYYVALMESEYFAAAAVHGGAMTKKDGPFIRKAKRKIPLRIWVGTRDPLFPLRTVRATRDLLNANGINAELIEMDGRNHNYFDRPDEVNRQVWDFLKGHELSTDPRYEWYRW